MAPLTRPGFAGPPSPVNGRGNAAAAFELSTEALFADLAASRRLLLAVSGGPDSTALLLLIDRWRKDAGAPVVVATVDHRLREGSDREAQAVAALCQNRGLVHHTLVREGEPFRTRIQERAREARYALLAACAERVGADTIVTAHHADDQAETILMRLTRGSGPAGLAGMAAVSRYGPIKIARPLLDIPKETLIEVCRAERVSFIEDPSNADIAFRRAVLRRLAPKLAAEGLDGAALRKLGKRAARAEAALQWAEQRARDELRADISADRTTLPAGKLAGRPEELVLRLIAAEIARLSPNASFRLERLESLAQRLCAAMRNGDPFAATLQDCTVRLRKDAVTIARAPARKSLASHHSSAALLGKGAGDA